jgi:hypothetical protein
MQGIYNIPLHLVDPRLKEKVGSLGSWHDPWIHPQSIDRVEFKVYPIYLSHAHHFDLPNGKTYPTI